MGTQYYQLICKNGHQISFWHKLNSAKERFCEKCGETTFETCQSCDFPIHGYNYPSGVLTTGPKTFPIPYFCKNCGKPYPWTELILNNAVELVSLDEELTPEQKEIIKNAFPDLIVESPTTQVAVAKYKKLMPKATTYIQEGVKTILFNVVSASVNKSLWG